MTQYCNITRIPCKRKTLVYLGSVPESMKGDNVLRVADLEPYWRMEIREHSLAHQSSTVDTMMESYVRVSNRFLSNAILGHREVCLGETRNDGEVKPSYEKKP